jgi:hypothetical protein
MVILYIYSICWRMKLTFYECQQPAATPAGDHPGIIAKGINGRRNSADFSATGFDRFVNERRPCKCLQGQVVMSAPSPWSWAGWRSTPRYEGLMVLRMWQGGRPIVSVVNDCGHGGRGDGWRVTQRSHA